jgi:hypothetical protein
MADKQKTDKKKQLEAPKEEGVLVDAAKAIGKAAGTVANLVGATHPQTPAKPKIPKLQKKDKHKLPRRQKKALMRTTANRVG